jgi:2-deoxy-D-gluconate 3-dehydrogenase
MGLIDLFSLEGKVAIITGGSKMYGKSCSAALAEAGAKLYIASHSPKDAEETADELRAAGGKAEVIEYHQDDAGSMLNLILKITRAEGRIDVLVNAARVIPSGEPGWFQEEEGLDFAVKVNSAGMLYLTMLTGKQMILQRSGSIISFASMMGMVGVEKHNYDGVPGLDAGAGDAGSRQLAA